jgi:hypothetical protein
MENYSRMSQPQDAHAGVSSLIHRLSMDDLRALLQDSGFRVEVVTDEGGGRLLRSATSGLPFFVRFGNRAAADEAEAYVDFSFYSILRVEGEVPGSFADEWNATRRFARVHRSGDVLVVQMDVSVVGGVAREHIVRFTDIWDRLVNDLLRTLRDRLASPKQA